MSIKAFLIKHEIHCVVDDHHHLIDSSYDVPRRLTCRTDEQWLMYEMILLLLELDQEGELFTIYDHDLHIRMNGVVTRRHLPEGYGT